MCLLEVYSDEDMNAIIEELPEVAPGVVKIFKFVCVVNGKYHALNFQESFAGGINCAKQPFIKAECNTRYYAGFHFWSKMEYATDTGQTLPFIDSVNIVNFLLFCRLQSKGISATHLGVISCFVKKDWITAAGKTNEEGDSLVASQAFFPAFPEVEAKPEDFLGWLKENDPEYTQAQLCEQEKIKQCLKAVK